MAWVQCYEGSSTIPAKERECFVAVLQKQSKTASRKAIKMAVSTANAP
jgi:hypothetical protein